MSFETKINEKISNKQSLPNKINISILKYFWQASPLSGGGGLYHTKIFKKTKNFKELLG